MNNGPDPVEKIYIAGPMTGREDYNFPAFHDAAEFLREEGYGVVSPAELDEQMGLDDSMEWADYLRRDIPHLIGCDAVAVLDGWRESRGATLEVSIARSLGMPIVFAAYPWEQIPDESESVLQEAERLVNGPRGDDYGHPIHDFSRTGRMWGAILDTDGPVPPEKVGLCMAALKLSRECNRPKRDNRVDASGYMLTVDMIETYEGA